MFADARSTPCPTGDAGAEGDDSAFVILSGCPFPSSFQAAILRWAKDTRMLADLICLVSWNKLNKPMSTPKSGMPDDIAHVRGDRSSASGVGAGGGHSGQHVRVFKAQAIAPARAKGDLSCVGCGGK